MRTVRIPGLSFMGVHSGLPDKIAVRLNDRERAALKRAVAIRDEARDRIIAIVGVSAWEDSPWYTAWTEDFADDDPEVEVWPEH